MASVGPGSPPWAQQNGPSSPAYSDESSFGGTPTSLTVLFPDKRVSVPALASVISEGSNLLYNLVRSFESSGSLTSNFVRALPCTMLLKQPYVASQQACFIFVTALTGVMQAASCSPVSSTWRFVSLTWVPMVVLWSQGQTTSAAEHSADLSQDCCHNRTLAE